MPRILIRCDIGGVHGMGHASRCKALADVLVAHGTEVRFVTESSSLAHFVAPHPCHTGGPYTEAMYLMDADVVVFDCKSAVGAWAYREMNKYTHVVRVDVIAEPGTADLVILPNAHTAPDTLARLHQDFPGRLLHGWDYVMLPEDVTDSAPLLYTEREAQIVFCAGGSDPDGALQQMYDWTADLTIDAELCFLIGKQQPLAMRTMGDSSRKNVSLLASFTRAHLAKAALVVTMFGQVTYEALWYQTPVVAFGRTEEDAWGIQRLAEVGVNPVPSDYLALWPLMTRDRFCATVEAHMDKDVREGMHATSAGLLDGRGVTRITDAILALAS